MTFRISWKLTLNNLSNPGINKTKNKKKTSQRWEADVRPEEVGEGEKLS